MEDEEMIPSKFHYKMNGELRQVINKLNQNFIKLYSRDLYEIYSKLKISLFSQKINSEQMNDEYKKVYNNILNDKLKELIKDIHTNVNYTLIEVFNEIKIDNYPYLLITNYVLSLYLKYLNHIDFNDDRAVSDIIRFIYMFRGGINELDYINAFEDKTLSDWIKYYFETNLDTSNLFDSNNLQFIWEHFEDEYKNFIEVYDPKITYRYENKTHSTRPPNLLILF